MTNEANIATSTFSAVSEENTFLPFFFHFLESNSFTESNLSRDRVGPPN